MNLVIIQNMHKDEEGCLTDVGARSSHPDGTIPRGHAGHVALLPDAHGRRHGEPALLRFLDRPFNFLDDIVILPRHEKKLE